MYRTPEEKYLKSVIEYETILPVDKRIYDARSLIQYGLCIKYLKRLN